DPLDRRALDVHARAGHGQHGPGNVRRPEPRAPQPEAMVKPLRRLRVAHRPGELDPAILVQELRPDDSNVLVTGVVLETLKPAGARQDVGVENHDVVLRVRATDAAVDVRREAAILAALHELDAFDAPQGFDVRGVTGIVGDHNPYAGPGGLRSEMPLGGAADARDQGGDSLRVAIARDDDRHGSAVLPVPADRLRWIEPHLFELEVSPQRGEAKWECDRAVEEGP